MENIDRAAYEKTLDTKKLDPSEKNLLIFMVIKIISLQAFTTKSGGFTSIIFESCSQQYYSTCLPTSIEINVKRFSMFMIQLEYKNIIKLIAVFIQYDNCSINLYYYITEEVEKYIIQVLINMLCSSMFFFMFD